MSYHLLHEDAVLLAPRRVATNTSNFNGLWASGAALVGRALAGGGRRELPRLAARGRHRLGAWPLFRVRWLERDRRDSGRGVADRALRRLERARVRREARL